MQKTLVLLVGPHGSGKTTLVESLSRQGSATRLRQYTTRPRREGEGDEYRFVSGSPPDALWRYSKAGSEYGFARSELAGLPDGAIGVAAAHTEAMDELKQRPAELRLVIVGLDTLAGLDEQLSRVDGIEGRVQSAEEFEASRRIARGQEICLTGDLGSVLSQLTGVVERLKGAV